MPKNKNHSQKIEFRPAKPTDASLASRLLFSTFPKKATFIIGLGSEDRARKILRDLFSQEGHRLSYQFAEIACVEGGIVGISIAYPERELGRLNRRFYWLLLKQYHFRGKLALIIRGWPTIFITEAKRNEFFLSNLAVKKHQRSQGIGAQIISHVEKSAQQQGFSRVSLMVSIENKNARRFYESCGYVVKAMHLESNKRVAYLGPGYQRMVKALIERK